MDELKKLKTPVDGCVVNQNVVIPNPVLIKPTDLEFLCDTALEAMEKRLNQIKRMAGLLELLHLRLQLARNDKAKIGRAVDKHQAGYHELKINQAIKHIEDCDDRIRELPGIENKIRRIIATALNCLGPDSKLKNKYSKRHYGRQLFVVNLWVEYCRYCVRAQQFRYRHEGRGYLEFPNNTDAKLLSAQRMMLAAKVQAWKDAPEELAGQEVFSDEWWKTLGCQMTP